MASRDFPILFITANRIGDAVLSSGLIHRLSREVPNARFTIVAGPLAAPLFADTPGLARLIVMEKTAGKSHWFKLWTKVRGKKWKLIVDLRGSGLSGFLRRERRAVHKKNLGVPVHKVVEAARLLNLEDDPPAPYLFVSDETQSAADALLAGEGPILAVGHGSNWVGKIWPVERFGQTANELLGPKGPMAGGRLLILGGEDDRRAAEELARVLPRDRVIDLTGRIDILTAYAVLKRARLFIGNDSGLMHLAAAAGAPTVGLFGPSDDQLYGPWGQHARAVRGPRSFEQFKHVDPTLSQAIRHMSDLPVAVVAAAAYDVLKASAAEPVPLAETVVETPVEAKPKRRRAAKPKIAEPQPDPADAPDL